MYTVTHHYLTIDDNQYPTVEVESASWSGDDPDDLIAAVRRMIEAPGGRSGTTISLTVATTTPTII